jgi:hypothetical protein
LQSIPFPQFLGCDECIWQIGIDKLHRAWLVTFNSYNWHSGKGAARRIQGEVKKTNRANQNRGGSGWAFF